MTSLILTMEQMLGSDCCIKDEVAVLSSLVKQAELDSEGLPAGVTYCEQNAESVLSKPIGSQSKRRTRAREPVKVNVAHSKSILIRNVISLMEWVETEEDEDDWNLFWSDTTAPLATVLQMKSYQRCNHYVGMNELARKDNLGRNMNRLEKAFPREYNFFPKTYTLPADYGELRAEFKKKRAIYIVKPDASSQGKGIYLTKNLDDIDPMGHFIVQHYIKNPLLVESTKFDLRIYVLVVSCDPLRIYLYREGLARFATEIYTQPSPANLEHAFMHLTNYSINKNSSNFVGNDTSGTTGSKRRITAVFEKLKAEGYDTDSLWTQIKDLIIKTLIAVQPKLAHLYHTCFSSHETDGCFELLGFDVIIQQKKDGSLKPILLEVNHSPSMNIDTPLDKDLKTKLLLDVFKILNIKNSHKKKSSQTQFYLRLYSKSQKIDKQEEDEQRKKNLESSNKKEMIRCSKTLFEKIYPCENSTSYDKYYLPVTMPETLASQARKESIQRQQEEKERERQMNLKPIKKRRKPTKMPIAELVEAMQTTEEEDECCDSEMSIVHKLENTQKTEQYQLCKLSIQQFLASDPLMVKNTENLQSAQDKPFPTSINCGEINESKPLFDIQKPFLSPKSLPTSSEGVAQTAISPAGQHPRRIEPLKGKPFAWTLPQLPTPTESTILYHQVKSAAKSNLHPQSHYRWADTKRAQVTPESTSLSPLLQIKPIALRSKNVQ